MIFFFQNLFKKGNKNLIQCQPGGKINPFFLFFKSDSYDLLGENCDFISKLFAVADVTIYV